MKPLFHRPASTAAAVILSMAALFSTQSATHNVDIVDFVFVPESLTIQTGDTVVWTQKDSFTHTTTSGANGVADGIWDSGNMTLSSNTTFSFTFEEAGTFPYFCIPHKSFMRATIIVEASAPEPIANPIPDPLPAGDLVARLVPIATGMVAPLGLVAPKDGSNRLFVHDQVGLVHVIQNDEVLPEPLLDARSFLASLSNSYDERGLLGFTIHPDFPEVPKVYTHTSEPAVGEADYDIAPPEGRDISHHSVFAEWSLDAGDPNRVDPASRRVFLRVAQPQFNHNGGAIQFGTDGFLYLSLGDGGGADDVDGQNFADGPMFGHGAEGNGQNPDTPLGAILRIDIDGTDSANGMYGIPADNPFVGGGGIPELYALGFRNPYAFHFDPPSSLLFVGDVGQNDLEEINIISRGGNYGWNLMEGSFFFYPNGNDSGFVSDVPHPDLPADLISPIAEYDHDEGLAVVGGLVYRGTAIPKFYGRYITADWGSFGTPSGRIFYLDDDLELKEFQSYPDGEPLGFWIKGFGQDHSGEIYLLTSNQLGPSGNTGTVYKFVPIRPEITGISPQGEDILLTWEGHSGPVTIQHAAAPSGSEWSDVTEVDGDSIAIVPPANEGFLRVIETGAGDLTTTRVILAGAASRPNPNPTAAVGIAVISIEGDTLTLEIAYQNLSATATAAHIHGPASIDQTAGPMINLAPYHQGDFAQEGRFTGTVELTANQKNTILDGMSYINIHSSTYPGGEIRGQIIFRQ